MALPVLCVFIALNRWGGGEKDFSFDVTRNGGGQEGGGGGKSGVLYGGAEGREKGWGGGLVWIDMNKRKKRLAGDPLILCGQHERIFDFSTS